MSTSEAVRYYLRNAVNYPLERESKSFLYDWVESNSTMIFGRNVTGEWEEETGGFRRGPFRNRKRDEDEEGEKEERLPRSLETVSMWLGETPENKPVSCTAEAIMEAFHLDEEFHELITFWCLCIEIPELARLAYPHRFGDSNDIIPSLLGLSKKDYEQMFIANNPLWRKGLIGGGIHI